MPTAFDTLAASEQRHFPPRKQWTRDECAAIARAGIDDMSRFELIEGELVGKMGKHQRPIVALYRLCKWLRLTFGEDCVFQEPAIDVAPADNPTSEPEPDAIVLARPYVESDRFRAPDLRLLIEVSDSTLHWDLTVKASLYARAEIAEYWVLDINGRRLITHREPSGGQYTVVTAYQEQEWASPQAAPGSKVRAVDLLKQ